MQEKKHLKFYISLPSLPKEIFELFVFSENIPENNGLTIWGIKNNNHLSKIYACMYIMDTHLKAIFL